MRETVEKEVIERLRRPYVKAVFQDSVAWGLLASMAFTGKRLCEGRCTSVY